MKSTRQIDIYLTKKSNVRMIDVVQFDTGIHLVFTVKDFTIPSGATAKLYVQKPSGKFVFQEDGITIVDNTILIDLENQAITEHGKVPYQVSVINGSDMITAFTGLITVEKSLKDAGATESKTVIRAFDKAVSDHVAEFQTKAEQIVQACIATIPEDYTVMAAKVNELANAIKGNVSGAVVSVDDVSTVEHNPVVRVHGKNLVPYGTITFTKNRSYLLDNPLPAGTYTISAYITSSDTDGIYSAVSINNKSEVMKYIALKRGVRVSSTFTVDKPITNIDFCSAYNYAQGEGDSATWSDVQLEEGSVATEYVPHLDPSTVTVKRCGKNLLPLKTFTATPSSTTATVKNGVLTVNGYLVSHRIYAAGFVGEVLTLSCNSTRSGEKGGGLSVEFRDASNGRLSGVYKQNELSPSFSFTVPINTAEIVVFFYASGSADESGTAEYKNIQLELGNTETAYEAYNGAEYITAADGTVSGVTSLSPTMTILTDTAGAIVECEYAVDTKTYIDRKISEILKGGLPT